MKDWLAAAERFQSQVSDDDEVLVAWKSLLTDFNQHLPVLLKLSHKALTVRSIVVTCHYAAVIIGCIMGNVRRLQRGVCLSIVCLSHTSS